MYVVMEVSRLEDARFALFGSIAILSCMPPPQFIIKLFLPSRSYALLLFSKGVPIRLIRAVLRQWLQPCKACAACTSAVLTLPPRRGAHEASAG